MEHQTYNSGKGHPGNSNDDDDELIYYGENSASQSVSTSFQQNNTRRRFDSSLRSAGGGGSSETKSMSNIPLASQMILTVDDIPTQNNKASQQDVHESPGTGDHEHQDDELVAGKNDEGLAVKNTRTCYKRSNLGETEWNVNLHSGGSDEEGCDRIYLMGRQQRQEEGLVGKKGTGMIKNTDDDNDDSPIYKSSAFASLEKILDEKDQAKNELQSDIPIDDVQDNHDEDKSIKNDKCDFSSSCKDILPQDNRDSQSHYDDHLYFNDHEEDNEEEKTYSIGAAANLNIDSHCSTVKNATKKTTSKRTKTHSLQTKAIGQDEVHRLQKKRDIDSDIFPAKDNDNYEVRLTQIKNNNNVSGRKKKKKSIESINMAPRSLTGKVPSNAEAKSMTGPANWGTIQHIPSPRRQKDSSSDTKHTKLSASTTKTAMAKSLTRAGKLAAATKTPVRIGSRQAHKSGQKRMQNKGSTAQQKNSNSEKFNVDNYFDSFNRKSKKRDLKSPSPWSSREDKIDENTPSFGPAFFASKSKSNGRNKTDKTCDIHENDLSQLTPRARLEKRFQCPESYPRQSHDPASASPPRQRKARGSSGPLVKMLRSIQSNTEADCARFQSGSFNYRIESERRMDVNDPRNRADTYMDVTIMGMPIPFTSGPQQASVLGFIHKFSSNETKCTSMRAKRRSGRSRNMVPTHLSGNNTSNFSTIEDNPPQHAWICFQHETVFEIGVTQGTQLRLYNPILVSPVTNHERHLVLCTKLCELYPKELEPLPEVLGKY